MRAGCTFFAFALGACATAPPLAPPVPPPSSPAPTLAHAEVAPPAPQNDFVPDLSPRVLVAYKVKSGALTIDGVLDETAWQTAPVATNFLLASADASRNAHPSGESTTVKALWDDQYLYVAFAMIDDDIVSKDFKLWTEDAAEVFLAADSTQSAYVQIATNPHDIKMSFAFAAPREPESGWDAHMKAATRIDAGRGWTVEFAIPLEAARGTAKVMANVPPHVGTRWRVNFCRQDGAKGRAHETSTWSPTSAGDIHTLETFGTLEFANAP